MYKLEVIGGVFTIEPTTQILDSSFDGVKFKIIGAIEDYKDKMIFSWCNFENCVGLPNWITMIASNSYIELDKVVQLSDFNSFVKVIENDNTVVMTAPVHHAIQTSPIIFAYEQTQVPLDESL
jgi:hypothetical protein